MPQESQKPLWKLCAKAALDAEFNQDYEAAEKHYTWALALAEEAHGSIHEDVGEALVNLADFYMTIQKYENAEAMYHKALNVYRTVFGEKNLVASMITRVLEQVQAAQDQEAYLLQAPELPMFAEQHAS